MILDAGALIAYERRDRRVLARLVAAVDVEEDVVVPATVLAQTWRSGPRQALLARLIKGCLVDGLDGARARQVGELLGSRDRVDVPDGHVAVLAVERGDLVLTSDPEDLRALAPGARIERVP